MTVAGGTPIEVLLVEDNPGDVRLTAEALKQAKVRNRVHVAVDGVEAMEFLRRTGRFADAPRPDVVLLDLNLPRRSGHEVLTDIKGDDALKSIPVVVLTSSQADEDIARSYRLAANAFVTKPVGLKEFLSVVQSIENFWLEVVRLSPE